MKRRGSDLRIALFAAGLLSIGGQATSGNERSVGDGAFVAQNGAGADPRLALPSTIDRALKSEIEAAATSAALEQVLLRHPGQGQLIVPRIEALAIAEIRTDGPRERFVIPGLEPDEGQGNSVTLEAAAGRTTLLREFPGDSARARFSDGSVHRFVGQFPFADVLTLFGEGDKDHRLTFAILDELGMVYVRGTGRVVIAAEGKERTIPLVTSMSAAVATRQSEPLPGKVPFERVCAACHGENAEGGQGPRIAGIDIEYDELLAKVRHGGGEMPSIPQKEITDDEVKQVLEYLKSL